jgi:hypothetical protein
MMEPKCMAGRAGMQHAGNATRRSMAVTPANVAKSFGATRQSRSGVARPIPHASGKPSNNPVYASVITRPTTT